jgi:isoleucyl-tRNA synthetase
MKGNLQTLEPKILEQWNAGLFERVLEKNKGRPLYVLHDGPPYANGKLHVGHALNKTLKDIVVKYKNLAGYLADFVPGWDCHGLPIELAVEKKLRDQKIDRRTMEKDEFLSKCREYALEYVDIQRTDFKRMGVLGRWDAPYKTLDFHYEAQQLRELGTLAGKGALYRKKRPVYWCIIDRTALAEAEVEYEEHTSPSVYVAFPVVGEKNVSLAIWTTTPWTLPANLAICAHPKFEYVYYQLKERVVIVAKGLLLKFLAECAPDELKTKDVKVGEAEFSAAALADPTRVLKYASGEDLAKLKYKHVFYDRASPVLLGEHVTLEQGTGLVHTAPGHGQEDYLAGIEAGLDIYNPVKNDGTYDETVGPRLAGKRIWDANPMVVDWLVEAGVLLNEKGQSVTHSYPHCWRCHNPVVFRATFQWFVSLEKNELRKNALKQVDEVVKWVPGWGRDRIRGMLETRPDWCISRQRTWGVPIAIALCDGCEEPFVDEAFMGRVAAAVEKEGAGVWYRTPVESFLPAGHKCPKCGGAKFRRETDILDVWFDSACSFAAVAAVRPNMSVPVDLYLEGTDQHRGWFHSSLLVGVGTRGFAPYKTCLTHGFLIDGKGEPMSKSKGNVVASADAIKEYGADVMRLWVASSDYRGDITVSKDIFNARVEAYKKLRNTLRYALSNLYDFDPAKDAVPHEQLLPLDQWARARLDALVARVGKAYEAFEFHTVYHSIVDFCASDLSAVYFDILKDALYTTKKTGLKRRSAQTVMHEIAHKLLVMLAPVMSFTAEEAWSYLPGQKAASVFLNEFPRPLGLEEPEAMTRLLEVRAQVLPVLEVARRDKLIGKSLEAKVVVATKGARPFLEKHLAELPELLIVSQVELSDAAEHQVKAADGAKCPRCWRSEPEVGAQELCNRCVEAVS